jgi:hypothetical protein
LRVFLLDGHNGAPREGAGRSSRSLGEAFAQLIRGESTAGSFGHCVTLNDGQNILVDWLILGDSDCFATFTGPASHTPDYLLLLARRDEALDGRQLAWFLERILKPLDLEPHEHVVRGIRLCESPAVVVASASQSPTHDRVMETAETAFAQAFLRGLGERQFSRESRRPKQASYPRTQ